MSALQWLKKFVSSNVSPHRTPRERIVAIFAKEKDLPQEQVTDETEVGPHVFRIFPLVALEFNTGVDGNERTTIKNLVDQVSTRGS